RRHRHPAAVTAALAPDNPARAPSVAGNPDPAHVGVIDPAPVVIDDVIERIVRDPVPSVFVGVFPIAVRIGLEIISHHAPPWLPDIAPDWALDPAAPVPKPVAKGVEAEIDVEREGRLGWRDCDRRGAGQ